MDPIVFNYRHLFAYIKLENEGDHTLDPVIASLMHTLGFIYEEVMLEENPETARFPIDDPYTIAECWARLKGFEECLNKLVGSIPTPFGGATYRRIMKEVFRRGRNNMSIWEFFKLYIEMKVWIALLVGIPLALIVVGLQYYFTKESEKRKKLYRERREYERKNNG